MSKLNYNPAGTCALSDSALPMRAATSGQQTDAFIPFGKISAEVIEIGSLGAASPPKP